MADFECTCSVAKGERAAAWGEDCWCWYPKPNYNERIVRCKDCKHYEYIRGIGFHDCTRQVPSVKPDGFCAWGERRQDA